MLKVSPAKNLMSFWQDWFESRSAPCSTRFLKVKSSDASSLSSDSTVQVPLPLTRAFASEIMKRLVAKTTAKQKIL
jgi:hypothetical protein